jgi:hypothetical protein
LVESAKLGGRRADLRESGYGGETFCPAAVSKIDCVSTTREKERRHFQQFMRKQIKVIDFRHSVGHFSFIVAQQNVILFCSNEKLRVSGQLLFSQFISFNLKTFAANVKRTL